MEIRHLLYTVSVDSPAIVHSKYRSDSYCAFQVQIRHLYCTVNADPSVLWSVIADAPGSIIIQLHYFNSSRDHLDLFSPCSALILRPFNVV